MSRINANQSVRSIPKIGRAAISAGQPKILINIRQSLGYKDGLETFLARQKFPASQISSFDTRYMPQEKNFLNTAFMIYKTNNFEIRLYTEQLIPLAKLQKLGEYANSRGVYVINLVPADSAKLLFTRVTCKSLSCPIELFNYIESHKLPWSDALEQPEFLPDEIDRHITGEGKVIALRGVVIGDQAYFETTENKWIVLREGVTVDNVTLKPGTVVAPGKRVSP